MKAFFLRAPRFLGRLASGVAALALLVLGGCQKKQVQPPLVVVTTGENAPFSMSDRQKSLSGFDIDLINEIAKSMGRTVDIRCVPFDAMIQAVRSKQADIAIGAISITKEREELVTFSPAYHMCDFALLMLEETSGEIEDLVGTPIAVRRGTWQETAVKEKWLHVPNLVVRSETHATAEDIVTKLRSGEFKAFVLNSDEARYVAKKTKGLKVIPLDLGMQGFGIATAKDSIYSQDIANYVTAHKEDVIKNLEVKWFSAASDTKKS